MMTAATAAYPDFWRRVSIVDLLVEFVQHIGRRRMKTPCSPNLQHSHHSLVLMLEDVAMVHPFSRVVVEVNENSDRRMLRHVARVLPTPERLRNAVAVDDLKVESMKMKWMVHSHHVLNRPDLGLAQTGMNIDAMHVHLLPVDESLRHHDRASRSHPTRIEDRY